MQRVTEGRGKGGLIEGVKQKGESKERVLQGRRRKERRRSERALRRSRKEKEGEGFES